MTWFPVNKREQTNNLTTQDSLLNFHSTLEHMRNYTLAAFLDVQSAFDRVGALTAIDSVQALSLRGRLLCFLQRTATEGLSLLSWEM